MNFSYSRGTVYDIQCLASLSCVGYTTGLPSELSFRILHVSNFHDVELLMRIIALDNANATDALAETIHQQRTFSTKATVP